MADQLVKPRNGEVMVLVLTNFFLSLLRQLTLHIN